MKKLNLIFSYFVLLLKGTLVGFGAILPGVSGGTLCVAFGMYQPIMSLLSHPVKTLKKDGLRLFFFILGGGIGFLGLAGLAAWLLDWNTVAVTCVFVGFIIGTLPELWRDSGEKGRTNASYLSLAAGFILLLAILITVKSFSLTLEESFLPFVLCGFLFCMSFVVPGLSSSNIIIFLGLYTAMMHGISALDFGVLIPLAIGAVLCVLTLPHGVNLLLKKYPSPFLHAIVGLVLASTVMIVPVEIFASFPAFLTAFLCMIGGCAVSFGAGKACDLLQKKTENAGASNEPTSEN